MQQFFFNRHHDFWPLYDTIKQYYLLGFLKPSHDQEEFLQRYPGQEKLWEITSERINNYKQYRQRWKPFQEHLKAQVKKPVHSSDGLYPCYAGYVPFKKQQELGWKHRKELHFAVSLLGPYYTIYGLDTSTVELPEALHSAEVEEAKVELVPRRAVHAVTVSPHEEYAAVFSTIEQAILTYLPDYRLVPYHIGSMTLQGLVVDDNADLEPTIHAALFHPYIPERHSKWLNVRGDTYYGFSQWRIKAS